jgi:hypothetical protein
LQKYAYNLQVANALSVAINNKTTSSGCGESFQKNQSQTFTNLARNQHEVCCNSNSKQYKCVDYVDKAIDGNEKMGQLMVIVEYKLKSDNTAKGIDRRKTKKFVVNAQMVPKINGELNGADNDGTFVAKCGTFTKESQAPQDTFIALDPIQPWVFHGLVKWRDPVFANVTLGEKVYDLRPENIPQLLEPIREIDIQPEIIINDPTIQIGLGGTIINPPILDDGLPQDATTNWGGNTQFENNVDLDTKNMNINGF